MIDGILTTIKLGILCWSFAFLIGIIIGTLRHSPWKLTRFFAAGYTEFFRNIPLLVQLFFWYFAAPSVLPQRMVKLIYHDTQNVEFWVVVIGLSIYTSSRVAEQVRAGIGSISREQFDAALSTGLTTMQMYRFVIVPLSIRIMMPPLTTEFLTTFKNTSLAMTVGVLETTFMSQQIEAYTFHGLEATTGASLVYITITMIIMLIMTNIEKRLSVPGFIIRQR